MLEELDAIARRVVDLNLQGLGSIVDHADLAGIVTGCHPGRHIYKRVGLTVSSHRLRRGVGYRYKERSAFDAGQRARRDSTLGEI